jgi:hypothetical protein
MSEHTLSHLAKKAADAGAMFGCTQAWQQAAKVEATVEKAPRCRKVDNWSKERFAI